jgi:hypothetical protein
MPPKKNMKKSKPKRKAKAKPAQFRLGSDERPVISKPKPSPTSTTNVDNRKISNKPQTQSVNVNVSVGGKSTESKTREPRETRESSSSKKSTEQFRSFAPTIIPQYVYGNPPYPPQPPNRVVQPIYNPIRPNPIMTSQQSLDQTTSLTAGTIPSGVGRMTTASTLDDDISSLSDFSSRAVVSQPNYAVSGLTDELRSESYKYSEPSGINLQSINSSEADMSMPIPRTNFTNRPFDTTQLDSFDEMAELVKASIQKSLQERIARPRPPLKEIIYDDGSIQVLSEEREPITLEMSKSDEPALSGIVDEEFEKLSIAERVKLVDEQIKKKRGKPPGTKNRPKEEIEAEKAEKEARKQAREEKMRQKIEEEERKEERRQRRSNIFANRQDEIDRRIEEGNRFDIVEQGVTQRKLIQKKLKEI